MAVVGLRCNNGIVLCSVESHEMADEQGTNRGVNSIQRDSSEW
jgi:hypothetical protein